MKSWMHSSLIRDLRLVFFDFGDDPSSLIIIPTIMDGFGRLTFLGVMYCSGDFMMFAEVSPIQILTKLTYNENEIEYSEASEIIPAFAMRSRPLKSISLYT
jgi:hypothetical protein